MLSGGEERSGKRLLLAASICSEEGEGGRPLVAVAEHVHGARLSRDCQSSCVMLADKHTNAWNTCRLLTVCSV